MKQRMKKWLAIFLIMLLCCETVPYQVFADEMNIESEEQMPELMTQSRSDNFNKAYSLTMDSAANVVAVALAQEGKTGSNLGYTEEWCADFVCDCAKLAGQQSAVPLYGGVSGLYDRVLNAGGKVVTSPQKGDLAFIDWDKGGGFGHVEIVYDVSGTNVYTIGGNSGDGSTLKTRLVKKHNLGLNSGYFTKLVRPNYEAAFSSLVSEEYPCYLTVTASGENNLWNMPCSDKTSDKAQVLAKTTKGGTYTADRIYENSEGNFWYRVKNGSQNCYLYSGNTSGASRISVSPSSSGLQTPSSVTLGSAFSLRGTITSPNLPFREIGAYIYQGSSVSGSIHMKSVDNTGYYYTFDIRSSVCNQNLLFNQLTEGTYTYLMTVVYDYYSATGNKLTYSREVKQITQNVFTVKHSCNKDTYLWNDGDHPHYSCYECSVCGAVQVDTTKSNRDSWCVLCRPGEPVLNASVGSNGSVTFTWQATANTTHYELVVYGQDDNYYYDNFENVTSGYTQKFPSGLYEAYLIAYDSGLMEPDNSGCVSTWSDSTQFYVENITYTISYNANGGSGAPSSQTKTQGEDLTLSSTIPSRFGYTFLGWNTSSGASSPSFYAGDVYDSEANAILYAVWKEAQVLQGDSITFVQNPEILNGGAGVYYKFIPSKNAYYRIYGVGSTDSVVYLYDASGNEIGNNDDGAENRQFLLEQSFNAGTTYYIYVKFYSSSVTGELPFRVDRQITIAYDGNGGINAPLSQYSYVDENLTISTKVPVRDGYTFLGWAKDSSAVNAEYQPGESFIVTAPLTLYAVWEGDCSSGHHNYEAYVVEPTCEREGFTTYICNRCYDEYRDNFVEPLDHEYGEWYEWEAPDCENPGVKRRDCIRKDPISGENCTGYNLGVITALGHTYVDGVCKNCGGEESFIAKGSCGEGVTWILDSKGVLKISGEGAMKIYEYKSEMPWYPYRNQLISVVIENGVTSIGDYAFYGMPELKTIKIPDSVTVIGEYAFKNSTAINNVKLPSGLKKLGESAFYGCTALTSIDIPASLYTVHPYTFKYCENLAIVTFHEGNLEKISDGAFYGTAVTELELPDCLNILDMYSFKNCAKLAEVNLGTGITQIREAVLYGTAINTITIPEGVTSVGPYAFKNCLNLETVSLPESLTSVGEAAFYACTKLQEIEIPDAVTKIDSYAFRKCTGLASVKFGKGLTVIGESSFYGCTGLSNISIPGSVTTIKGYAFKACAGLENVSFSGSLNELGESAFHSCTGLTTVIISKNVKKIGEYCFSGSTGIKEIIFVGGAPTIGAGAFNKITAKAYYPDGNTSWTEAVKQNYGGNITWIAE